MINYLQQYYNNSVTKIIKDTDKMKLVYIAGPYSATGVLSKIPSFIGKFFIWFEINQNIKKARKIAQQIWSPDYSVFCPHTNTAHFNQNGGSLMYLRGDIIILQKCDVVFFLKDWKKSKGAVKEMEVCKKLKIEIVDENEMDWEQFLILKLYH